MRAAAAIALVVALPAAAPPAQAETVARADLVAGPALAGDRVAWGELTAPSAARVVSAVPGAAPVVTGSIAPATTTGTTRGFLQFPASFAASADVVAGLAFTATTVSDEGDSIGQAVQTAAVGGPLAGPLALLSGSFPPVVSGGPCSGSYRFPEGVDVDGARIAVAEQSGDCGDVATPLLSVALFDAAGRRDVTLSHGGQVGNLRIAGNLLAWVRRGRRDLLIVRDLGSGAVLRRISARSLGARYFDALALRPDGGLAFTYGGRRDRRGIRLGFSAPGSERVRVLDRDAGARDVALAGGRVLYERVLGPSYRTSLVLRRIRGNGHGRTLARFGARRERAGSLDFDGDRATWAVVGDGRVAHARIVRVSGL